MSKTCSKCKQDKPLSDFYHYSGRPHNPCKACASAESMVWWRANKAKKVQMVREWRQRNAAKFKLVNNTSSMLWNAIKRGDVVRGTVCERCQATNPPGCTKNTIEASHHDYNKPYAVTWLCTKCHRALDAS